MKINKQALLVILLLPYLQSAYAVECQPNESGGSYCINDDGTTSNSIPNDQGGQDTHYSNGKSTSTYQDGTGIEYTLSDKGVTARPSPDDSSNDTSNIMSDDSLNKYGPKPDASANALLGSHWNRPSNINSGDSATSSITLDDPSTNKWP